MKIMIQFVEGGMPVVPTCQKYGHLPAGMRMEMFRREHRDLLVRAKNQASSLSADASNIKAALHGMCSCSVHEMTSMFARMYHTIMELKVSISVLDGLLEDEDADVCAQADFMDYLLNALNTASEFLGDAESEFDRIILGNYIESSDEDEDEDDDEPCCCECPICCCEPDDDDDAEEECGDEAGDDGEEEVVCVFENVDPAVMNALSNNPAFAKAVGEMLDALTKGEEK